MLKGSPVISDCKKLKV